MNSDRALRHYYRALRGSEVPKDWSTYRWILAGPAAVALMLAVVAGLPSSPVHPGEILLRHQAQTYGELIPAGRRSIATPSSANVSHSRWG